MSASEHFPAEIRIDDALRAEPLGNEEMDAFRAALNAAGLPAGDVAAPAVQPFRFMRNLKAVGYGAVELYGSGVLLRSIVVAADARGAGVGRKIVDWLLAHAADNGALRAFLFTTNARAYFESLGFATLDRSRAPRSSLTTRQAAGLCPASAALLTRAVSPSSREAEPFEREQDP